MPDTLSKIERKILDYLVDYLKQHTYQPSIREIGRRFGIKSTKTVSEHLQSLAEKGYIERDASRSRGVKILGLDLEPASVRVPVYGQIAAGRPALLRENVDREYVVDPRLLGSTDSFLLQARGDSMEGIGILDGDLVMVEPTDVMDLANGDIVAARVSGEATVKRYFARDGQVVLEPANSDYAPILVRDHDDFTVLGKVTGLFRHFTADRTAAISA
jgi:repressor LexA